MHEGRSFEPTGVYRLPMGLEQLPNLPSGAAPAVLLLFDFVGRIAVTLFVPLSTALPTTE